MTHPFDEFSKSLSEESVPRRELLRRLGAVFAGAVLGPLAMGSEAASDEWDGPHGWPWKSKRQQQSKRKKPVHRPNCAKFCNSCRAQGQKDQCLAVCRACNSNPDQLGGVCGAYVCCAAGESYCNGVCANLNSDPNNCGSCGHICPAQSACINGVCLECPAGLTKCGNSCVDLNFNNNNCGACGSVCPASTPHCTYGTCSECQGDFTLCGGTCVDTYFDRDNCGGCGVVCAADAYCEWGVCIAV